MTHTHEHLFESRRAMLRSIEHDVTPTLYESLSSKIADEEAYLFGIYEAMARETREKKRNEKRLRSEYFEQKRMDTNIL